MASGKILGCATDFLPMFADFADRLITTFSYFLLFNLLVACGFGQELPRQVSLGAEAVLKDSHLVISAVTPGGTAAEAGILVGDFLLRIGEWPVGSPGQLSEALHHYHAGDRANLLIERSGEQLDKAAVFQPKPYETSPDFDILYNIVVVERAKYRAIVTRPKTAGPFPAILLIGGLGCYSLDGLKPEDPYREILYPLTRQGFVTMRVEKSGEGDSEGPPCNSPQSDLHLAVARSVAGIDALKSYSYVDAKKVFIFAHSIGPIEAALVVNQVSIAGVIAAETIGKDWFTYDLEIARSQPLLLGQPYDQVETGVRLREECNVRFYVQKQTPDTIAQDAPQCAKMLPPKALSYTYMQQIGAVDLAKEWKSADIPALVIYGTSDPLTDADESRYLVDMINSFHPGRATYLEVPNMNHYFEHEPSKKDGMLALTHKKKLGEFEPALLRGIEAWLDKINNSMKNNSSDSRRLKETWPLREIRSADTY